MLRCFTVDSAYAAYDWKYLHVSLATPVITVNKKRNIAYDNLNKEFTPQYTTIYGTTLKNSTTISLKIAVIVNQEMAWDLRWKPTFN